jgi:hypothetical protein
MPQSQSPAWISRRAVVAIMTTASAGRAAVSQPTTSPTRALRAASSLPGDGPIQYRAPARNGSAFPRVAIVGEGAALENVDCSGCYVSVQASRVVLRGCRFTAVQQLAVVVDMYSNCKDLTVELCHFDGMKMNVGTDTMLRARDGTMIVRDCLFENLPNDGVNLVGGSVVNCTFRGAGYLSGAHADAIAIGKTVAPIVIMNNTIDYRNRDDAKAQTTSAIAIGSGFGNIADVRIEQNVLLGGAYSLYVTEPPKTAGMYRCEKVVVRNNLIGGWMFGPLYPQNRPADLVFERNQHYGDRSPLSSAPQKPH